LQVANLAVFRFVPLYTAKLRLRALPTDDAEREALLSGLKVLAGPKQKGPPGGGQG
jgi:hypothetical protein